MDTTFLTKSGECELTNDKIILSIDPELPKFRLGYDEFNYKNRIAVVSFFGLFVLMYLFMFKAPVKNLTILMIMLSVVYGFQFYQLYLYSTVKELYRKDVVRILYRKSFLSFGAYFHVFYVDDKGKNKNRIIMFRNKEQRKKALEIFKNAGIVA